MAAVDILYVEWWVNGRKYGVNKVEVEKCNSVEARVVFRVNREGKVKIGLKVGPRDWAMSDWFTVREGTYYVSFKWHEFEKEARKYTVYAQALFNGRFSDRKEYPGAYVIKGVTPPPPPWYRRVPVWAWAGAAILGAGVAAYALMPKR